jgi:hypothetical protein
MGPIRGNRVGPLREILQFFSRVTLRNSYRALTQLHGFKVSLTKIAVSKLTDIN